MTHAIALTHTGHIGRGRASVSDRGCKRQLDFLRIRGHPLPALVARGTCGTTMGFRLGVNKGKHKDLGTGLQKFASPVELRCSRFSRSCHAAKYKIPVTENRGAIAPNLTGKPSARSRQLSQSQNRPFDQFFFGGASSTRIRAWAYCSFSDGEITAQLLHSTRDFNGR